MIGDGLSFFGEGCRLSERVVSLGWRDSLLCSVDSAISPCLFSVKFASAKMYKAVSVDIAFHFRCSAYA